MINFLPTKTHHRLPHIPTGWSPQIHRSDDVLELTRLTSAISHVRDLS